MHVLDGYVPTWVVGAGFAGAGALAAATLRSLERASPPRVAMITSAFFAASLLSFPLGGTSVHLSLLGLAGVVLGRAAFPAVLVGVVLQRLLFGHGGVTTLGINACTMGGGALVAAAIYHAGALRRPAWRAGAAAAAGTLAALLLYGAVLLTAGEAFEKVAWLCLALHAPLVLLEAVVTAQVVAFLGRVQPDLVRPSPTPGAAP